MPRASVIVPCRNATATLPATLESIRAQTFEDFEVLVVDHGSDDDPASIVESLGDARVRLDRISSGGGPSRPRNHALARARGEVVFFCDADDVMRPDKMQRQIGALDARPGVGMVFTDFEVIDASGRVLVPSFLAAYETLDWVAADGPGPEGGLPIHRMLRGLLRANFVGTSTVAVRRSVLQQTGGFDEDLASSEDFDLWMRVASRTACLHVDEVHSGYRRHGSNLTSERAARHPRSRISVLERYEEFVEDAVDRRAFDARMAGNHLAAAYALRGEGRWDEARAHYRCAFARRTSWTAVKGMLTTLPGPRSLVRRPASF